MLEKGLRELGFSLPEEKILALLRYIELIEKWNKVYNLTAIRDREKMVSHHLLDCLAILPYIAGKRGVDVGSGAGFPGLVLAICLPEMTWFLVEPSKKKAAFLKQAAIFLALKNVEVVSDRAQNWKSALKIDIVTSRAFSSLREFAESAGHLCSENTKLYAMKGLYPEEELADLPGGIVVEKAIALQVPGLEAERHLIVMKPV